MKKIPRTTSQESANVSINKALINLLQQTRTKKVAGERGRETKRYYQVWLSMKKYLRRSSSHAHFGNAAIWLNHQMMEAAMTRKMIPWMEIREKYEGWLQCDICGEYFCPKSYDKRDTFLQMMIFFVVFALDHKY